MNGQVQVHSPDVLNCAFDAGFERLVLVETSHSQQHNNNAVLRKSIYILDGHQRITNCLAATTRIIKLLDVTRLLFFGASTTGSFLNVSIKSPAY